MFDIEALFNGCRMLCLCRLVVLDGVVCINCDSRLLDLVGGLVMLAAVVVVLVCDRLLRAGALSLTVGLAFTCRLLRNLFLVII